MDSESFSHIESIIQRGKAEELPSQNTARSNIPNQHTIVVTCMDTRISPYRVLNLQEGEVHLLRNAGGVVTEDVIRSILISHQLLETTEVLLIQHTKCGLIGLEDETFKKQVEDAVDQRPDFEIGGFNDVHENIRDSVAKLRNHPLLTSLKSVRGFLYDVDHDELTEIAS